MIISFTMSHPGETQLTKVLSIIEMQPYSKTDIGIEIFVRSIPCSPKKVYSK